MDTPKTIREKISAFSDHELSPSTLPDDALRSAEGEHAWHAYHRIRDVIREQGAPNLSDDFAGKLAARLAAEPSPVRRVLRAPGEALERRAPVVAPVAVAAGAAGPVTGIGAAPDEAGSAGAISEPPLDPDAQAAAEAADDALDTLVVSGAAAAEASIAAGAEAVTIAVVKAAASSAADIELKVAGAADAAAEGTAEGAAAAAAAAADGTVQAKADVTVKPPITSVS